MIFWIKTISRLSMSRAACFFSLPPTQTNGDKFDYEVPANETKKNNFIFQLDMYQINL